MKINDKIRREYVKMFNFLFLRDKILYVMLDDIVDKMLSNQARYQEVENVTGCAWWFVAIIHYMESSMNFDTHLHNGDPLTDYTVNVPSGRPVVGNPPFSWKDSAIDAIKMKRILITKFSPIEGALYELEKYNGFGYRKFGVNSPYLWGQTNHHSMGKFTSDGKFDPNAKTEQMGAAAILRRFAELGFYIPEFKPTPVIFYDPKNARREVEQLQIFLNKVSPHKLRVDGKAGYSTNLSFFLVFGVDLPKVDPNAKQQKTD